MEIQIENVSNILEISCDYWNVNMYKIDIMYLFYMYLGIYKDYKASGTCLLQWIGRFINRLNGPSKMHWNYVICGTDENVHLRDECNLFGFKENSMLVDKRNDVRIVQNSNSLRLTRARGRE